MILQFIWSDPITEFETFLRGEQPVGATLALLDLVFKHMPVSKWIYISPAKQLRNILRQRYRLQKTNKFNCEYMFKPL
jgi:hypothetical protein